MSLKKIFSVLLFLAICFPARQAVGNTGLIFSHLTRNDGLLHDNVTCFAEDSIGYIWIGTHRGLNRYDGYSIDSYTYDKSRINAVLYNRVYDIEIIGRYIWMATQAGIACFDIRSKKFVDFAIEDPLDRDFYYQVRYIKSGSPDQLWLFNDRNQIRTVQIVTDRGTGVPEKVRTLKIGGNYNFESLDYNPSMAFDPTSGGIWISGRDRIEYYSPGPDGSLLFVGYAENVSGRNIKGMRFADGKLWIASWDNIVRYSVRNGTEFIPEWRYDYSWRNVSNVCIGEHSVWIGSDNGLLEIDGLQGTPTGTEYRHSPLDATSIGNDSNNIFLDSRNNVWVSTWGAGVSYADTNTKLFKTVAFPKNRETGSEFVSSIHASDDGYIYLATKFGGISRFRQKTKDKMELFSASPLLMPSIASLQSRGNHLFAAVNNSIAVLDKRDRSVCQVLPCSGHVFWLAFDRFGRLWSSAYGGLDRFEFRQGAWRMTATLNTTTPHKLTTDNLHNIYSDTLRNELVVTSVAGVNRIIFDDDGAIARVVHYTVKDGAPGSLSSNYLWPLDKAEEGVYWVGSMGSGLNLLRFIDRPDGTFDYEARVYGMEDGAPSNDIESIETDRYGNVWCGGYSLSCFDTALERFNVFDTGDGLQSYMFGTSSSDKDAAGTLYFGSARGLNYFTPVRQSPDIAPSPVYFSRVAVSGSGRDSGVEFSHSLELPYPDNTFSVDFTTLSFNQGRHTRYRYRLEGYDNQWHSIEMGKDPRIAYQKLPYGHYKLLVESGGWKDWSGSPSVMTVTVLPPFWLSWYAKTAYVLLLLWLVYLGIRWFRWWMQMKQTLAKQQERERQKEEMMQMKMRFFTDVSHEFKTPLTLINSAIAELDDTESEIAGSRSFSLIKRNNRRLLNLINELLDFHRSDIREARLRTTYTGVSGIVAQIYEEFVGWAQKSGLSMSLDLPDEDISLWLDQEHFGKILSNLLSNAIRYSEPGGTVNVSVSSGDVFSFRAYYKAVFRNLEWLSGRAHLIVTVRDTGVGITEPSLPMIFERFHQVDSKTSKHLGSGIGLALVRSLVRLHHGGIIVSSERNVGTEITVAFPIDPSYLTAAEKVNESSFELSAYLSDYALELETPGEAGGDGELADDKPTLLLVDDNQEILMVLRENFKKEYNVIMAFDGEEAWQKCHAQFPDLVISDVMMPKMNGMELCSTLKGNLRTCFIPVILLTAKSLVENQIEGLQSGADAYIPKPFDVRLLKATVRNLLSKSRQIREGGIRQQGVGRKEVIDGKLQSMAEKLTSLVGEKLTDPDFSVDHLCMEMGINRTKLYATIKTVSGMTLGNYIRKIRLDKAAELLKETDMTITEVGYAIGIDSPSYFTRAFKAQFGYSPSDYVKEAMRRQQ